MHLALPTRPGGPCASWLNQAVFGLDRWLRDRQGIYECSNEDYCLFRIQSISAERTLTLSDGTTIAKGNSLLGLHLWNEHIPALTHKGPTIAWAHQIDRAFNLSMRDLARYLAATPGLDDVIAIRADLRLGDAGYNAKLARITAHYGFEAPRREHDSAGRLHRFRENILIFMLLLASNPAAIRLPALPREHNIAYLSLAALDRRYAADIIPRAQKGRDRPC